MIKTELKKAKERIKDIIHTCDVGISKYGKYDDLFQKDKEALQTMVSELERLEVANDAKERQIKILIGKENLKDIPWY